jgi:hypothetical protein
LELLSAVLRLTIWPIGLHLVYLSFAVNLRRAIVHGILFLRINVSFMTKGGSVLQRPTQTAAFWRDQFEVTADDTEFLYQLLLDAQKPIKLSALALALINEYLRRENTRIEQDLSKSSMCQSSVIRSARHWSSRRWSLP